ncbi:hypothetical protein E4U56_007972 [Claviceps arundinis]|uniref:Stc1 domain-containing protein n=1 Tax=Claviceps arundinis TaxID=1623583 RepID=A0A9P7MVN3_9HYPO|nr:hypothetical protein E4U56_007972 [Claviceps arundinis]
MNPPQAVRAATEENPAIDSASVSSSRCCSGCTRTLPLSAFPLKPRTGERALQCELCKARHAKRRQPTQDPEQDADDQDDGLPPARRVRLDTEAPALDSASVPSRCCSGCTRTLPLSAFPLKPRTGERALQCELCKARHAKRRQPTQDPEQDADDQDDGLPPARRVRLDTEAPALDSASVPSRCCSGCKKTLPLSDFPTKSNKILRNCVRCKARKGKQRPPTRQMTPPQIGQENVAPPPARRPRQSGAWATANRSVAALAGAMRR